MGSAENRKRLGWGYFEPRCGKANEYCSWLDCCYGYWCDKKNWNTCQPNPTEPPTPEPKPPTPAPKCAGEGFKSRICGSRSRESDQECCEGLVCHEFQYWRCVKEENKFCAGARFLAQECGAKDKDTAVKCCDGLVCSNNSYHCEKA